MTCSRSLALLVAVLLCTGSGCAEEEGDGTPSCTISDDLGSNQLVARVDGADWVAESQGYQVAGAVGFLSSFNVDAQNLMTVRLAQTAVFSVDDQGLIEVNDGDDVVEVFGPGAGPFEFFLGTAMGDGGDVTLMVDGDTFHTGDGDGGGFMYIDPIVAGEGNNPDVARGCFYFDAGTDGSDDVVSVISGSFAVNPL